MKNNRDVEQLDYLISYQRNIKNGEYLWKRALKFLELILNNIYVICFVAWKKSDVVHFQWFPLLEVCSRNGGTSRWFQNQVWIVAADVRTASGCTEEAELV